MIKVVLTLLTTFHLVSETSSTYQVISFIGDVTFYFMPFLIAANAAKVFRVNQSLALFIAGVYLSPTFVTMVAGDAAITLFGLPITKATYSYSVIPVILMVWITHYIEILVDKITPKMVKLILNPTLVILISAPIALIVVGPLGTIIGNGLAVAINFLSVKLGFIIVGILAATFPFIVMTGMHHALTPIGLNAIATGGTDTLIFVSQVCSNLAQSGASWIFFGKETAGLPEWFRTAHRERCIRLPMRREARSLNLSNSVAILTYEALRQNGFPGLTGTGEMAE